MTMLKSFNIAANLSDLVISIVQRKLFSISLLAKFLDALVKPFFPYGKIHKFFLYSNDTQFLQK